MSAPDLTDDELDQRLRAASAALAGLAPAGRVDALALRVEAELAQFDLSSGAPARTEQIVAARSSLDQPTVNTPPLESRMTSDTDEKSGPANVTPPSGRTEDSGLHDIKALAQDTRRRISRRITSQHDVDPDMLASSTGSLRMIALPEPAMVVALPEAPTTMEDVREAMKDPAMAAAAAAVPIQRKRTTLWVGLGAAAVAAAAAAVILSGGVGSDKKSSSQVATAGTSAAPSIEVARVAAPAAGSAIVVAAIDPGAAAGSAALPPAAPETASGAATPTAPTTAPAPGGAGGGGAVGSAKVVDKGPRGGSGDAKPASGSSDVKAAGGGSAKPGGDAKTTAGSKPAGGAAAGGATTGGNKGEKSIEDLLNDASGGSSKPKDTGGAGGGGGGGDSAPAGPTKTSLEPKEIKAGMSAVSGAAQSCFGKHGVAGHVKVKATVASSGSVTKVDATGEFAGTPTGACVAGAVKGASFPSWTGAPMTVTYSFTLQE